MPTRTAYGGERQRVLSGSNPKIAIRFRDRLKDCLQAALNGETIAGISLRIQVRDGHFLNGLLSAGPLKIEENDFFAAVGIIIGLSQEKGKLH